MKCPNCGHVLRVDDDHTYDGDRDTSNRAAWKARPNSGTQRRAVLDLIAAAGPRGRTDEEIAVHLRLSPNSVRPRRLELLEGGWVKDSGRTRPTLAGNDAIVWVAVRPADGGQLALV